MNYRDANLIFIRNQSTGDNTYLVPRINFDTFYEGEITIVKFASDKACTVYRSKDGKLYNLTADQIKKFKCVGNC